MMYLTRSEAGKLLLCQKRPSRWSSKRRSGQKRELLTDSWNAGQVFALDVEIPGSYSIPNAAWNGTMYGLTVELFCIGDDESQWVNPLWVTRERNSRLILHHKEEPSRMRESEQWESSREHTSNLKRIWDESFDCSIKKDGKKWTSWKSHFTDEFEGSENIRFDDEFPTKVGLRIPKEIPMGFMEWMKNYSGLDSRPMVENKKRVLLSAKPKK